MLSPQVLLLHGFPELGYSWRHQVAALEAAGYRAVAPDMRGYADSPTPDEVDAYDVESVGQDVLAMLDEPAVVVGHDWGAEVAWHLARAHPEMVSAVVGVSVPFRPPLPAPPLELMRQFAGEDFYFVWFQEPGVAEAALSKDVRRTLATTKVWDAAWAERDDDDPPCPPWMTEDDLQVYVDAFERTGFTGGLNYYRNVDRNWEIARSLGDRRIEQPSLFITGSRDPIRKWVPADGLEEWLTDLRGVVVVEGAGHWVQQQAPDEVNGALLDFLDGLD